MLLSYEVTSASRAKDYFASSVSPEAIASRRDYYSEGQESPGTYGGKLGVELGLAGKQVDEATFHRLCDNRHPTKDKPLTPRTNDHRRVCYDFTFSGPKSFSIIEAFASDEERRRLRQAFDESVTETVSGDIEPDMQTRERKHGADHDIVTGNVLTAAFPHATARPENDAALPDMHWHDHLLVWNATRRADGRIHAGQFGDIIRDKPYYRAAFYARLAGKLEALGFVIDRRGGTEWEIAGVPQSAIDKFSKRTTQIDGEAERRGITDAAAKAELGAKIRAKKQKELTMPELRAAWDAQLTDGERDALAAVYRKEIAPGRAVTAGEAVSFALAHLAEQLSVFPERELKRVALLHGLGSVTPDQIAAELPRHGVITAEIDGRLMATTAGLQEEESFLVNFAACGQGKVRPAGVDRGLTRRLADGKSLNDEQWAATCGLLNSCNRVNIFEGPAGAGKSWSLEKFDEGMRLAGGKVTYLATTTGAVEVLAKAGFEANTLARFLLDEKMQQAAKGGRVVVDEISLCGHQDAHRLFTLAENLDLTLILTGDRLQHGAVPRGALIRVLKDYAGIQPFTLSEIMRQEDPAYRAAAKLLSEGKTLEGFDALEKGLGWVKEIGDGGERHRRIAADYLQAAEDNASCLVISPTHAEAAAITAEIRTLLRQSGKLGTEEREFTRLVAVNASEAERGQASTYRAGDLVIQFHQSAKGFKKGERLAVTDAAEVPLALARKFQLYRREKIALAAGDKLRFTGPVKCGGHKLSNGATHRVAGFTRQGDIALDNGWVVPASAGHFRSGFVETSFGAQGKTVRRVIVGMSSQSLGATNMEQMYVSSTRAREKMTIYTDDSAAIRSGVQRSSQKLAALDLLPKRPAAGSAAWIRQDADRMRRLAALNATRAAYDTPPPAPPQPERPGPGGGFTPSHAARLFAEQQARESQQHGR